MRTHSEIELGCASLSAEGNSNSRCSPSDVPIPIRNPLVPPRASRRKSRAKGTGRGPERMARGTQE